MKISKAKDATVATAAQTNINENKEPVEDGKVAKKKGRRKKVKDALAPKYPLSGIKKKHFSVKIISAIKELLYFSINETIIQESVMIFSNKKVYFECKNTFIVFIYCLYL